MKLSTAILSLALVFRQEAPLCRLVVEGFLPRQHIRGRPAFAAPSLPSLRAPTTRANGIVRKGVVDSTVMGQTDTCQSAQNGTDAVLKRLTQNRSESSASTESSAFDIGQVQQREVVVRDNKVWEFVGLGTWIAGLSSFLLVNNFVGPWPEQFLTNTPVEYFGLMHALAAMLFGGGVILTTLIEWLVTSSKNASVLNFWFGKVPGLDAFVVLPALTASIVSGVGLSVDHYNSLSESPFHVVAAISTLLAFAVWWAATDLTTQGAASEAIEEWTAKQDGQSTETEIPQILHWRKLSNLISCLFVSAIYAIMVLKPGT